MSKNMEIEVNGETYQLVAGFGFLHEVNKRVTVDVPNTKNKKEVGLKFMVASIMDGDIDALVDCIFCMNIGQTPRLKKADIERSQANACKKEVKSLMTSMQEEEKKEKK